MKVMIDTNILVSAALNADGTPYRAYLKAVTYPNQAYICEQNVDELYRVFRRKFPDKISALDRFFAKAALSLTILRVTNDEDEREKQIRDAADRPILRAALNAEIDVFVTGDKDFLEAENISSPQIMTAARFLEKSDFGLS